MIRRATIQDASVLAALSIEVWTHTYLRDGISKMFADYVLEEYSIASMAAKLADPDAFIWLYEEDGLVQGYLYLASNDTPPVAHCPNWEIVTLYIRQRHKRQGLGKALLEKCFHVSREHGIADLYLSVNAENIQAIDFYETMGFSTIGEWDFAIEDGRYRNWILARVIGP